MNGPYSGVYDCARYQPVSKSTVVYAAGGSSPTCDEGVIARLVAEDGERAVQRVQVALEGEPFTVEDEAQPEPD